MPPSTLSPQRKHLPVVNAARRLAGQLSVREALSIVGSLGHPSKMPGFSYGISAFKCQRGSELRSIPGSVCSACYARKDFYATYEPLLIGHARRWDGLEHPRWVDAMVLLINRRCTPPQDYFRWHDSGDLQSVEHLARIVAVCAQTPEVKHWLPTREYAYVDGFLAAGGRVPENLTIRLSGEMIDAEPVKRDNKCGECRACWSRNAKNVSYPQH